MKKLFTLSALALALGACDDSIVSPSASAGNSPGYVTLSGEPIIGQTLTAIIEDNDGFDADAVTYQWLADGEVVGPNSHVFTLSESVHYNKISVVASYVDNNGNVEENKSTTTAEIVTSDEYTNVAASFSGDLARTISKTATQISGTVVISDDEGQESFVAQANVDTTYGLFSIDETGFWTYDLDTTNDEIVALTNDSVIDAIAISSFDRTDTAVVITIEDASSAVLTTQAAEITDADASDAGELRYKFSDPLNEGKVTLSLLYATGETESVYVSLFDSANSTSSLIGELKIDTDTITLRNTVNPDTDTGNFSVPFTAGDWLDVEMTWNTTSTTDVGTYSVKIDGTSYGPFPSQNVTPGVEVTATTVKYSTDSGTAVNPLYVDDYTVYPDELGVIAAVLDDDFEDYSIGQSLDKDDYDASLYNSSTFSAVVAEVSTGETVTEDKGNYVAITDTMTTDAGELRYKSTNPDTDTGLYVTGRLEASFIKEAGDVKDAYIGLYGTSTSTSNAVIDLRIQNQTIDGVEKGVFVIRGNETTDDDGNFVSANEDSIVGIEYSFGEWHDVVITWDASSDTEQIALTLQIDDGTIYSFSSQTVQDITATDGAQTVIFKIGDTSGLALTTFKVDNFGFYKDLYGADPIFEDDFEGFNVDQELNADSSSYHSSSNEAVIANDSDVE